MKINQIIVLSIVIVLLGCHGAAVMNYEKPLTRDTAILKTTLRGLNLNKPEEDIDINMENGDLRFICINGFIPFTPGVDQGDYYLVNKYGMRCLEGTSDAIESDEHMKLINMAMKYAERYNEVYLQKLKSTQVP